MKKGGIYIGSRAFDEQDDYGDGHRKQSEKVQEKQHDFWRNKKGHGS